MRVAVDRAPRGAAAAARGGEQLTLAQPATAARHTIFTHFAAGETLHDARGGGAARRGGRRCIVDHATEESTEASARAHNLERKLALLAELRAELPAAAAFVPVKLTALVDPAALERATASPSDADALLAEGVAQRRPLCEAARAASSPLLLDAEQTPRQPAIMRIARALSAEFNPRGAAPTLYNTHQMYLRGARATLDEEAAHATEAGYVLAVKLVRGAYMQTEPAAALQPSKGATDDAYDGAAALLLERVADGGGAYCWRRTTGGRCRNWVSGWPTSASRATTRRCTRRRSSGWPTTRRTASAPPATTRSSSCRTAPSTSPAVAAAAPRGELEHLGAAAEERRHGGSCGGKAVAW